MLYRPEFYGMTNVVCDVEWSVFLEENGYKWEWQGATRLGPPGEEFMDFNTLTEQQVISWVQTIEGPARLKELKALGTAWLVERQGFTATTVTVMPWQAV